MATTKNTNNTVLESLCNKWSSHTMLDRVYNRITILKLFGIIY